MSRIEEIDNYIKSHLSKKRYLHSKRVMDKALEYAKIYNLNEEEVLVAALSHDMVKEYPLDESIKYIFENNLDKSLLLKENIPIIHGFIAADILEKEYSFTKEMADAVRFHTTGRENMTTIDKVIFLADKTEDGRQFPEIEEERILARKNLDEAMIYSLKNTINYLEKNNRKVNKLSIDALNYLEKSNVL